MKNALTLAALGLTLAIGAAQAAGNKQRALTTKCNKKAADMKGDERQAFIETCLNAKPPQQKKLAACNAEAKDKTGEARKKFMSECLKGVTRR